MRKFNKTLPVYIFYTWQAFSFIIGLLGDIDFLFSSSSDKSHWIHEVMGFMFSAVSTDINPLLNVILIILGLVWIFYVYKCQDSEKTEFKILFEQGVEPFISSNYYNHANHYICRIGIINSSGKVVTNIQAKIHEITPTPTPLYARVKFLFPYNLRFTHDNGVKHSNFDSRFKQNETLHENDKMFFDVIYGWKLTSKDRGQIEIQGLNSRDKLNFEFELHDFKILISSDNGGSKFVTFRFDPTKEDNEKWVMLDE